MLKLVSSGRRCCKTMPIRTASSSSNKAGSRSGSGPHAVRIRVANATKFVARKERQIRSDPNESEMIPVRDSSSRRQDGASEFAEFPELPEPEDRTGRDRLNV